MVTRQPIDVRRAGIGDVEDLLQLWSQAREDFGPLGRPLIVTAPEQIRPRLQAALLGDDVHVAIARWDGRPAGYTLVRVLPAAALLDGLAVHIEQLYVVPELRRHGVARALLVAVTAIAERVGADQVVSSAPPGARDSHRFLARLGFSPVAVRRVAATSVLRRKLAGERPRNGLEDLLSRRRSLRARAGWPRRGEVVTPLDADLPDAELLDAELPDEGGADSGEVMVGWSARQDGPPTMELPAAELVGVGLRDADLRDAEARVTDLDDAGLDDAGLDEAGLDDVGLDDAGLDDAGLDEAGLDDAALTGPAALVVRRSHRSPSPA